MTKKIVLIIILSALYPLVWGMEHPDFWRPIETLEGIWEGQGDGMSGISAVTQEYRFILSGKFLEMKTKAVFNPQEKNPKGEIHEDLGIFSYDHSRKKFILRGFYVEGFVNQYILNSISEDGKTLTFETENIENAPPGTKAKLVFKFIGIDKLEQSFHVAFPGREFSCFSTNTLQKSKKTSNSH